jgi:hypothetical protein
LARSVYAVYVEDTASDEATSFAVEASSILIACTRTAMRLFGPDAETRAVYGCAGCGEELWDEERVDSSGIHICDSCTPDDLAGRDDDPEPVGLAVKTARITANELSPLPGDAPIGELTVIIGSKARGVERGEAFEDDAAAREALERDVSTALPLEEALGDLTVRDAAGAYFRYVLGVVPAPVDEHDLVERGLIAPPKEPPEEEEEAE